MVINDRHFWVNDPFKIKADLRLFSHVFGTKLLLDHDLSDLALFDLVVFKGIIRFAKNRHECFLVLHRDNLLKLMNI